MSGTKSWLVCGFEQIMGRMRSALEYQGEDMQGTRSLVWKCQTSPRFRDMGAAPMVRKLGFNRTSDYRMSWHS